MLIQVEIGGIWISFVRPGQTGPEPYFPYLVNVDPISQATSDTAASATCALALKAKELIGLNVQRPIRFVADNGETPFEGLIGRLEYENDIKITVEA